MRFTYWILFLVLLLLDSCQSQHEESQVLQDVETYIETRPDSAFAVLQGFSDSDFTSDSNKAHYAVLLAMAQDKNYIDKTDFETLDPAIRYYTRHGSSFEKMRMLYYQGRIYQNQKDYANATSCFLDALEAGKDTKEYLIQARIHAAQGAVYKTLYNLESYIDEFRLAAELFQKVGKNDSYFSCLLQILNGYNFLEDKDNAQVITEQCISLLSTVDVSYKAEFYETYLVFLSINQDKELMKSVLQEYIHNVPEVNWNRSTMALVYARIDEYNVALALLNDSSLSEDIGERMRYYSVLSEVYESLHEDAKALLAYREYVSLTDSVDLAMYALNVDLIHKSHQQELEEIHSSETKKSIILWFIIILVSLCAICLWIRARLLLKQKENKILEEQNENYRLKYLQIEEERDNLSALLHEKKYQTREEQKVLIDRLNLLNRFFSSCIRNNERADYDIRKDVDEIIANQDSFMNATRLAYSVSHPAFIHLLEEKGLTEWEINYCCLYALGLKGKEVGAYIKMRSHYNQSSAIREKLGINEHDTNLGIYLRKLLNDTN
jgi:cell division protein FtsL